MTRLKQQVVCLCLLSNSDRFRGEKVPTLQEAVEECIKHQLTIYFDVKGHPDEVLSQLSLLCMSYFFSSTDIFTNESLLI